jgi:nucleoid-associated protein YgaU
MNRNQFELRFAAILALSILAAVLIYTAVSCLARHEPAPAITPTLAISETPSITPMPLTATPTPTKVAPAAVPSRTATATETAVPSSSPPTAVSSPTPTLTAAPTLTPPPTPAERPSTWLVRPNDNLSDISEYLCGFEQPGWLLEENRDIIRNPDFIFAGQELSIPWPC